MLGAQAGVDPLIRDPSDASTESIIQSNTGFRITGASAQMMIDGFVFKAKTAASSIGVSADRAPRTSARASRSRATSVVEVRISIASSLSENASSFAITVNLVEGGGTGIQLGGDRGPATLLVENNLFRNATGGASNLSPYLPVRRTAEIGLGFGASIPTSCPRVGCGSCS